MSAIKLPIICPVAGVSYAQDEVAKVRLGHKVSVARDVNNPHDPFACRISYKGAHIGYIPKTIAKRLCESSDLLWEGTITNVLKGEKLTGLRVRINKKVAPTETESSGTTEVLPEVSVSQRQSLVYARSGRELGVFVAVAGDKVIVETASGTKVPYPKNLIVYESTLVSTGQ